MRYSKDNKFILCNECDESIPNNKWGMIKAIGWFFSKGEDKAFCPKHLPSWVPEYWLEKGDNNAI